MASTLISGMFLPPDEQIAKMRKHVLTRGLSAYSGLSVEALERLPEPPAWPIGELQVVLLVPAFGSYTRDFDELVKMADVRRPSVFNSVGLSSADGAPPRPIGLHWVVLDLGANYNFHSRFGSIVRENAARRGARLAGPEVLAAAWMFPEWVKNWGNKVPPPDMLGYSCSIGTGGASEGTQRYCYPYLCLDPKDSAEGVGIRLGVNSIDDRGTSWAAPELMVRM